MFARKLYYLSWLMKSQWKPKREIERFQLKRLKWMISYCYKYVRFYRKFWKINKAPRELRKLDDLKKFPIIDRKIIMENYSEFITSDTRKNIFDEKIAVNRLTSGSSSGHSLRILINEKAWDFHEAVYLRSFLNLGYKPWEKITYYWYEVPKRKWYNSIFLKKDIVLSKLPLEKQVELIEQFDNPYLYYFSSILYLITKIKKKFETKPKLIITHAEILSNKMRKNIENAFNAPVYDQYGSTEVPRMAWECKEREGYHIDGEAIILETVKDGETVTGEMGDIVITDLWNTTFPLIRYSIGDVGIKDEDACPCGRGLQLLKRVEGRRSDIFKIKGIIITPRQIIDAIDNPFIKKFDFNKVGERSFLLNIVPEDRKIPKEEIIKYIEARLNSLFPVRVKIEIRENDTPILARGKFKLVNNLTRNSFGDLIKLDPFSRIR